MNAGNVATTLATPAVTNVTNSMFSLVAASSQGCTDGSTGLAGASCQYAATFAPIVGTPDQTAESGSATINYTGGTAIVNMSGTATKSAIQSQTISNFVPTTPLKVGQQITLAATGGASGQPVTFSIDPTGCISCASVSGTTLTALKATTTLAVIVDANQAGGSNGGIEYAAATPVTASIAINSATPAGVPGLVMNQLAWLNAAGSYTDGQPDGRQLCRNAKRRNRCWDHLFQQGVHRQRADGRHHRHPGKLQRAGAELRLTAKTTSTLGTCTTASSTRSRL